jgi:hypothetical protein
VVRHTWGWQIDQKAISLNTFLNGYSRYRGVGLSRTTVIKCLGELSRMKFLIPIGKADADGQVWAIGLDPDLEALELRYLASKSKRQDQMNPVRAKRSKKAVYVTDQQSTAQTENGLQHRPEVVYAIDTIKDNLKRQDKEKESPAKKSSDQKPTSAPIGDSLSGDDPIAAAEAIVIDAFAGSGTTSVKAEDSVSKPADSKTTEKILPRPRAKAAGAAPTATEPAAPHPRNPLQDVICWGWKTKPGPWAGKLGQFFTASMPKDAKDAWASKQPDSSATPQEIAAFTLWYSQHPSYSKSFVEHGSKMPTTPTVLRDRLDEFRSAIGYQIAMNKAVAILERLSKGEQGAITPGSDSGAVESVQSFKRFNSKAETAYTARLDPDDDPENSPEETPVGVFS